MDRKSLEAAHVVQQMTEQHWNGGFYSEAVREQEAKIGSLAQAEKLDLYRDTFNEAWALAEELTQHPVFNTETGELDLREEGLGVTDISLSDHEADDDCPAFRAVTVVTPFEPVPEAYMHYGDQLDDIGHMEHKQSHPQGWQEGIYLDTDGTLPEDMQKDIDQYLLQALDAVETLRVLKEAVPVATPA